MTWVKEKPPLSLKTLKLGYKDINFEVKQTTFPLFIATFDSMLDELKSCNF